MGFALRFVSKQPFFFFMYSFLLLAKGTHYSCTFDERSYSKRLTSLRNRECSFSVQVNLQGTCGILHQGASAVEKTKKKQKNTN